MKTIKIKDYLGNLIYVDITNLGLSELIELRNSLVTKHMQYSIVWY